MQRLTLALLRTLSVTIFVAAIAWPMVAIFLRSLADGTAPNDGFTISLRQLSLLWRSFWMAGLATTLSLVLALPAIMVIGRLKSLTSRPLLMAMLAAVMLTPPMVCEFGWSKIFPSHWPHILSELPFFSDLLLGELRCLFVWSLWTWPIPALIIGTGWRRKASETYEAALLSTSPTRAFVHAALPCLTPFIAASSLSVFVILFNDYGAPHAAGVFVYATELLSWSVSSSRVIDTLWPSLPSLVITLLALLGIWKATAFDASDFSPSRSESHPPKTRAIPTTLFWLLCIVSIVLPIGMLAAKQFTIEAAQETLVTYWQDLSYSMACAVGAGLLIAVISRGLATFERVLPIALLLAIIFGAVPGAMVGESLVAGYNFALTGWLYDHWPISVLASISRFAWIGLLVVMAMKRSGSTELARQAMTDGAERSIADDFIVFGASMPIMFAVAATTTAFCLAEVPAATIVRNPDFVPASLVLIEKFHRLEDGIVVSISLLQVAAAIIAALLTTCCLSTRSRRH